MDLRCQKGKTNRRILGTFAALGLLVVVIAGSGAARADHLRDLQQRAEEEKAADWGHWGADPSRYSSWTSHSNRLVPIYTFGIDLSAVRGENSVYRNPAALRSLYGDVPEQTLNPQAEYFDQTDVYRLQQQAVAAGKKYIVLMVFDGMDWQTTQAAAIVKTNRVPYDSGRGTGLVFQDYDQTQTDFGYFVSSAHNSGSNIDVNAQVVHNPGGKTRGGYSAQWGGATPWAQPKNDEYLLGKQRDLPHVVTDSAASATSMTAGIKTYNAAINVDAEGNQVEPIARQLQRDKGFAIGVVTSVQVSHATPAAAYANNVTRNDYQDLTRDLLGLPSISHRRDPLPGVDVLLGAGWGETSRKDAGQGNNYVPGNKYLADRDLRTVDVEHGGRYRVAQRTPGKAGRDVLIHAARQAYQEGTRLLGFFGAGGGHLPYQTADGSFNPSGDNYRQADIDENPTLADMTRAALGVLSKDEEGFWLMIEAGDVDWANHANNLDNSVGAVLSGDAAFQVVVDWMEKNDAWQDAAVIVTADHGHYLVLDDPEALVDPAAVAGRARR